MMRVLLSLLVSLLLGVAGVLGEGGESQQSIRREQVRRARAGPVVQLLARFLPARGEDHTGSFLDLCGECQLVLPAVQQLLGSQGRYFLLYEDEQQYNALTARSVQPDTLFLQASFSFLERPVSSSETPPAIPTTLSSVRSALEVCPSMVRIATADAMLLLHSTLLECRVLFYLSNEFIVNSRDIIDMMLESGFVVYWHIAVPQEYPFDLKISADVSEVLGINIIALPIEWYTNFNGEMDNLDYIFPFEFGKYYLSQYNVLVDYTDSSIKLHVGHGFSEQKQSHRFYLSQRLDSFMKGGDSSDMAYVRYPLPPRPHCARCEPSDPLHMNLAVDMETTVKIMLQEEFFGASFLDSHSCVMCSAAELQTDANALYFPRHLFETAQNIYAVTHCNRMAAVSEQYHYFYHFCVTYVRIWYKYEDLLVGNILTVDNTAESDVTMFAAWNNNIEHTKVESHLDGPLNSTYQSYDAELCTDKFWCGLTNVYQQRISMWQNPLPSDYNNCQQANFLLYLVPNDPQQSLADILLKIGFMLRFAMCYDRILLLSFEYFNNVPGSLFSLAGSLSHCTVSGDMIRNAVLAKNGLHVGLYPCKRSKVVWMKDLPTTGHCSSYRMSWTGSYDFLYGFQLGLAGDVIHTDRNGDVTDNTVNEVYDKRLVGHMGTASIFTAPTMNWLGQMVRHVISPHSMLSNLIRSVVQRYMRYSPPSTSNFFSQFSNYTIARPFAVLHIRSNNSTDSNDYGSSIEGDIKRCLRIMKHKAPFIKNVYVPLASFQHFVAIRGTFRDFGVHFLSLDPIEGEEHNFTPVESHLAEYADIAVAVEADFFIGHLEDSSQAQLVNMLQHSRGDGGVDFHSIDSGSSWQGF